MPDAPDASAPPPVSPIATDFLTVRLEKKGRRGKVVTIVNRFATGADVAALATELRRHLATGGSVVDGEMEFQGDQRQRVVAWFEEKGVKVRGG